MGACFDELTLDGNLTESQVKSKFEAYQNECAHESGNSYSGRLNMCPGITFAPVRVFSSYSEAADWLQSKCQKWDNAIAVRYLKTNKIKQDDAKLNRLRETVATARRDLDAFERHLSMRIDAKLKSVEFVKCSHCKSRLETRFRVKTLLCPVCNASFATKTDQKNRARLKSKIESAETKLNEHLQKLQDKANQKNRATRWLIGGVCSS